jgi:hypothetical protein
MSNASELNLRTEPAAPGVPVETDGPHDGEKNSQSSQHKTL